MLKSPYKIFIKLKHKEWKIYSLPFYKHIAKAPRANAATKGLSKSLQSQRTEWNCFKKFCRHLKKNKKRWHTNRQKRNDLMTMTQNLNKYNGLQDWKKEHQAVINRTLSGAQHPVRSTCWTTSASCAAVWKIFYVLYEGFAY